MKTILYRPALSALNQLRRSINLKLVALLFAVGLGIWPFHSALAVPANPEPREVTQPDGTKIQVRLRGDEFFHWTESTNGYAVVKDTDNFWKYAQPATNQAEFRAIKSARVGSSDPARLGLRKRDLPDVKLLRSLDEEKRRAMKGEPKELPAPKLNTNASSVIPSPAGQSSAVQSTNTPPAETPLPQLPVNIPAQGTKIIRNIVILACFADHWDSTAGTVQSTNGKLDITTYSNLFNQVGYTNDGAVGSVRDYYNEDSYGKLTVQSIIVPWVQLPQNEAYYGGDSATIQDTNTAQMVADAVNAAAAAGFDFSQGDSDGDGWVDCLTIIHSGHGQENSGNPSTEIWSHQGSMSSVITTNGVKMYRYHTEPALRGWTTDAPAITRVGVVCHEMGHFFGLPDLYDYSDTTDGVGNWCIMAYGCWNSGGVRPAQHSAWCRTFLGFAKSTVIHSQTGLSLARLEDNATVGMLRDGMANGEYFLVENRAKTGFDNDPAIYPGMVIYHVDSQSANNDLGTWPHPVVKIEEADGNNSIGSMVAESQPGDVWSSTSGLSGGFCDQTGVPSANAMMYQTAAYNRPDNSAYYSYNTLGNFSAAGSTMTCDATTLKTVVSAQGAISPNYTVSWAPASQATQYEIQEGTNATLTSFSDGAEDGETMYDNWYLSGTVHRDANGAHSGSSSYGLPYYEGSKWYSPVQSITLQKTFKVTTSTVISFYVMSHIASGNGYIKCQLSNDGGNTWRTLLSTNGYINSWLLCSYNYTAINAQGINAGDSCVLRFIADYEYASGWSAFPGYGTAVDDISLAGIQMDGYSGWTSLANNVTTNNYTLAGKANGVYAYRVQAYANGAWQGFGTVGETAVNLQPEIVFSSPTNNAAFTEPAAINLAATVTANTTTVGNVRFYNGGTLLATLTTPPYTYTWTGVAAGNYTITAQADYNGSYTSTSAPVNVTVNYQSPTLVNDTTNTTQNTPVTIAVLANDSDPYSALALTAITQPARGTAAIAGTNVIYTPNNYWYGADSFTYTATNIHGIAATATVSVSIPFPNFASTYTNAVLSAGPVAYWRLNESSGATRAVDMFGGFNGTNNAGLILGTNAPGTPLFPGFDAGNTAYYFPSNTSVAIPALNLNTNAVTIAAWIKRNGSQADGAGIFACRAGTTSMELGLTSANAPRISWNGFVYTSGYTGMVVPDNIWTFMVLVVTPTQFRVFMATNSALIAGTNSDTNPNMAFAGVSYLGYDPNSGSRRFNGAIDEVALFNRSLTGTEINGLLAAAQTGLPAVALTAPADGSAFNAASNITLTASVTTNGYHTVEGVQFYSGASLLGTAASLPYQFIWSGAPAGTNTLTARLLYDGGSVLISSAANITVTNAVSIATNPTNLLATVSGNSLILNWPVDHTGWTLQVQTNPLSAGLGTNWIDVPGSAFVNAVTNTISPTNGSVFYRLKYTP